MKHFKILLFLFLSFVTSDLFAQPESTNQDTDKTEVVKTENVQSNQDTTVIVEPETVSELQAPKGIIGYILAGIFALLSFLGFRKGSGKSDLEKSIVDLENKVKNLKTQHERASQTIEGLRKDIEKKNIFISQYIEDLSFEQNKVLDLESHIKNLESQNLKFEAKIVSQAREIETLSKRANEAITTLKGNEKWKELQDDAKNRLKELDRQRTIQIQLKNETTQKLSTTNDPNEIDKLELEFHGYSLSLARITNEGEKLVQWFDLGEVKWTT